MKVFLYQATTELDFQKRYEEILAYAISMELDLVVARSVKNPLILLVIGPRTLTAFDEEGIKIILKYI